MKNLIEHLDIAKQITGSDYKTAQTINKSRQYISMARKGKGFSNECCRKLAEITGENALEIIAAVEVQAHPERKNVWAKWVAAMVIMSVLGMSNNGYISKSYAESAIDTLYIMRNWFYMTFCQKLCTAY